MLKSPERRQIKAGRFGKCGRMRIKPYQVTVEEANRMLPSFMRHVRLDDQGCWTWIGRAHNGYPCFSTVKSTKWAHRVSYAMFVGPITEQMHIDHVCRNRLCVNPAHLRQVTPSENYQAIHRRRRRDAREKQRQAGQLFLFEVGE